MPTTQSESPPPILNLTDITRESIRSLEILDHEFTGFFLYIYAYVHSQKLHLNSFLWW